MSAPAHVRAPKGRNHQPIVIYNFGQGRIAENLLPLARDALRRRGFGTHKLEAEVRNYLSYRGIDEVRPIRILKIVDRYVRVRPVSFAEMEAALGRHPARMFFEGEVPGMVWWIQDFLDYLDPHVGFRLRSDLNSRIERGPFDRSIYRTIAHTHLRKTGFNQTSVMKWIKEDAYRYNQWKRDLARAVHVRP